MPSLKSSKPTRTATMLNQKIPDFLKPKVDVDDKLASTTGQDSNHLTNKSSIPTSMFKTSKTAPIVSPSNDVASQMSALLLKMKNIDADTEIDTPLDTPAEKSKYLPTSALTHKSSEDMMHDLAKQGDEPTWYTVDQLPGYMQRGIRAMGKGVFSLFTRTSLEKINILANVNNAGPNSAYELTMVARWLKANATSLGKVQIDFSNVMPGYTPDAVLFRTDDTRFLVVKDDFGYYIYAFPEKDAIDGGSVGPNRTIGAGRQQQLIGSR